MAAPPPAAAPRPGRARRAGALILALLFAGPAAARPYTVDDLLRLESFGQTVMDPSGRWLVLERTDPYETGPRFDADLTNALALSRLYIVDLAHPGPAQPLLCRDDGPGYVAGPFSPSGARMVVYRLRDRQWQAAVVALASGQMTWLGVTPDDDATATTVQWISDRDLLVLARTDGQPPWVMRRLWEGPARLPARWARTAAGGAAFSVFGSGAWRAARPTAPPNDLLRIDVVSGARTRLATGAFIDVEAAPDGRRAALLESAGDLQPHADAAVQGPYGLATEQRRLAVVDLRTGAVTRPCPACDLLDGLLSWSADGRALLVFARPPGAPWSDGGLRRYQTATGRLTALPRSVRPLLALRPEALHAGWMGGDLVVYGRRADQPEARADWFRLGAQGPVNLTASLAAPPATLAGLQADGLTLVADKAVWRVDPLGGAQRLSEGPVTAVVPPRPPSQERAQLQPPPAGWALAMGEGPGGPRLEAWGPGGRLADLGLPDGARLVAWSQSYRAAVALTRKPSGERGLLAITPAGTAEVAAINRHLADVDPPRIRAIAHTGPDGQPLQSWLFLPPHPPRGGRPPALVIRPYLGDSYRTPFPESPYVAQLTVSVEAIVGQGYAVLLPSLPKPAGGADFVDGLADRLLAIVDTAAADPALKGEFDPGRLALWGHSYGGYTTALLISQTDRFRAAIASSPPTDLVGMFGAFQPLWRVSPEVGVRVAWPAGWTEDAQGGMGAPPWAAPERYVHASPIFQAGRIHTPLLLFNADQDFVPQGQAEELFSALYRQDRDAMLVTYWGEGHALSSPGTVRDRYARSFAWLARYLAADAGASAATSTTASGAAARRR